MQQQHENELVLQVSSASCKQVNINSPCSVPLLAQELELLDEDSNIFKLIGPVLIKQDPLEAKSNVKKRLEFIKGESDRLDSQCKKLEDKQQKRQSTVSIYNLSSAMAKHLQSYACDCNNACAIVCKIVVLHAVAAVGIADSTDSTISNQS